MARAVRNRGLDVLAVGGHQTKAGEAVPERGRARLAFAATDEKRPLALTGAPRCGRIGCHPLVTGRGRGDCSWHGWRCFGSRLVDSTLR
eukprot:scaffold83230_cov62-Phaeocystis_antarctica.AAC.2